MLSGTSSGPERALGRHIPLGRRHAFCTGLRARLVLSTTAVLAVSLAAGFAWVHHGLRAVLDARNDAFLERKADELTAVVREEGEEADDSLEAEIRREVAAYRAEGLVVILRRHGTEDVMPPSEAGRRLAERLRATVPTTAPRTLALQSPQGLYRVLRRPLGGENAGGWLELGLSLAETEATLAQFDRQVATGGVAFLALAVLGGLLLSRQALRPVAQSIHAARRLNPAELSARLPRTGAGDELDLLAGTLNDLLDRLAAYHAQVTRFTADASHELRSPLGALRAAIEVALQQPRTAAEYRQVLESLGEQCDRLTSLVNGLLLLARADAGEVALRREPVDLAALAGEMTDMYQPVAEERDVSLVCDRNGPVPIEGDPQRLRQLLTNLVDNALRFTPPGGHIAVRAERAEADARLIVADTGTGIAPEVLPHVFDRFFQTDPARSAGGSGLGLSICRWIAEAHGGTIHVASTSGSGSTFSVVLPGALVTRR